MIGKKSHPQFIPYLHQVQSQEANTIQYISSKQSSASLVWKWILNFFLSNQNQASKSLSSSHIHTLIHTLVLLVWGRRCSFFEGWGHSPCWKQQSIGNFTLTIKLSQEYKLVLEEWRCWCRQPPWWQSS